MTNEERRKKRHRSKVVRMLLSPAGLALAIVLLVLIFSKFCLEYVISNNKGIDTLPISLSNGVAVKTEFLTPNPYSRPRKTLRRINGVVVHYTANPGATAENNRNYFEGLAITHTTYASSHYIIGLKGEVIQCIPLTEISYASNNRNKDTISIECCHPDKTGKFNDKTYESLISLVAALCTEFELDRKDIIRHYDVTGKLCPLYYVEHEEEWEKFKDDVMKEKDEYKQAIKKAVD